MRRWLSKNLTLIISFFILLAGIASALYILHSPSLRLSAYELVSSLIQLSIAIAAAISALFVIHSYVLTNKAFILSQKPHLYLICRGAHVDKNINGSMVKTHVTQIHYENRSIKPFEDLTIKVSIMTEGLELKLDDLFSNKMYMASGDARDRNFETIMELKGRGFDISSLKPKQKVFLKLAYSFSFLNKTETINVQEYIWDVTRQDWQIK